MTVNEITFFLVGYAVGVITCLVCVIYLLGWGYQSGVLKLTRKP